MKKIFMASVFCVFSFFNTTFAHDFSWTNLMLAAVKMQPHFDYDANVDSYMQMYRPDVWNRYRNDEFELQDKREETIKIMKDRVASFSLNEEFVVHTVFKFGDYNFKKQLFPLDSLTANTCFSESAPRHFGSFPYNYKLFFTNPSRIGDIDMVKEDAKKFIQKRKDKYGSVNRRINAKLKFRIIKLKNGRDELEAELTHVTLYSDDKQVNVLEEF